MIEYTLPSATNMSSFYVFYKGAAMSEDPHYYGISHLVEHLVCRSLSDYVGELKRYAVIFSGTTSDGYLCFYIRGLEQHVSQFAPILLARLQQHITFDRTVFDQEKRTVRNEIVTQSYSELITNLLRTLKHNTGYYCPAGETQSVDSITLQDAQSWYDKQFQQPYMTIRVGKDCTYACREQGTPYALPPRVSLRAFTRKLMARPDNLKGFFAYSRAIPVSEAPLTQFIDYMLTGSIDAPMYLAMRSEAQLCYRLDMQTYIFGDYVLNIFHAAMYPNFRAQAARLFRKVLREADFLTDENIEQTKQLLSIIALQHEANRYADIYHLVEPTIYSEGQLDAITPERVRAHYDKYFRHGWSD